MGLTIRPILRSHRSTLERIDVKLPGHKPGLPGEEISY